MRRGVLMVSWVAIGCGVAGLLAGCVTPVPREGRPGMANENDGIIQFMVDDGLVVMNSAKFNDMPARRGEEGEDSPPLEVYNVGATFQFRRNPWTCYYVVGGVLMGPYTMWHPC